MITLTFSCSGCFAKKPGKDFVKSTFISISGRNHGLGSYKRTPIKDLAPEGWIAFDPYTQCTYCPACWASIEQDVHAEGVHQNDET